MESFGEKTSLKLKELQMAWCLAEGLKALDQNFFAKSSHISLMRDERYGRLAIRFTAVAPDLTTRHGFLGQAKQAGTGADNVSLATWAVMKRACSRFHTAPFRKNPGRLKKNLFQHLRSRVVALAADAAADEMASCEILRSATLSLNTEDNQPMLPNLQHVFRDRAHAFRRLTSRPWHADEKLKEVMQYMGRGPRSMAIGSSMTQLKSSAYLVNIVVALVTPGLRLPFHHFGLRATGSSPMRVPLAEPACFFMRV